jgi:hypothetical protein
MLLLLHVPEAVASQISIAVFTASIFADGQIDL